MIIAVDFDGILCKNAFPDIGEPDYQMISFIRQLYDAGNEIVLWTSRVNDKLEEAVQWCYDRGLKFDAINENAPSNLKQYGTDSRKIYADVYIDDHNIEFICAKPNRILDYMGQMLTKGVELKCQREN